MKDVTMKKRQNDADSQLPFYISSHKYKTSSEIITEARAGICQGNMNDSLNVLGGSGVPRALGTQRPFTPRERQRTLFGKLGRSSRPPSAVNLKYLQHQSNESIRNSVIGNKKIQGSSSFDDRTLDNIDEKPELSSGRKKKEDLYLRVKSLNVELDQDVENQFNSGSKLKLPSLNGLPKPLHHRKNQRSSIFLQSLSEDKEDQHAPNSLFYTSVISKSSDLTSREDEESISGQNNTISLDVFNKRRLFGDFQSKSEDPNELLYRSEDDDQDCTQGVTNTNTLSVAVQIPTLKPTKLDRLSKDPLQLKKTIKSPSICNLLDNLSNKDSQLLTEEDIIEMMSILYNELEKEIPWQNINGDEKATILKVLYKYVENSNERLLIAMARIILALRVTGSNLSGVCKLIFKVSRNAKNDHLFLNDNLLELFIIGLGRAEPLNDAECLIYGYGALKFLGMNSIILEKMRPLGILQLMTLHLKMFNEARAEAVQAVGEQGCHCLYQLTGALRNMAGGDAIWNSIPVEHSSGDSSPCNSLLDFVTEGTLTELCRTVSLFIDDLDVETNASRTLSVLSADYECCATLCEQTGILSSIVKLLQTYTEKPPLIVRLNYILGNMVACNNEIRLDLYNEPGAINALMKVLDTYLKQSWPSRKMESAENIIIGSDLDGSNGSDEDVMVKTIRVIANMCMNSTVGNRVVEGDGHGERILSWILSSLRQYAPTDSVELTVSTLAALNNISYYHIGEQVTPTAFSGLQIHFCEALCRLLSRDVNPWVTEAIRVLGNMSRNKLTRDYIVETGALTNIAKLTESDDVEASLAAAGVLVNMAADENARQIWMNAGGVKEAAKALQNAAENHHWQVAHLLCQALWNATPLPNSDVSILTPLLLDILDEQQVFGNIDAINTSFLDVHSINGKSLMNDYTMTHLAWEEFAAVAVNLLDKIDPEIDCGYDDESIESMFLKKSPVNADLIPI